MGRRKRPPPSLPSKAYLVSFGDTMTALLAFFIVINSYSKEQTGANMYSGTGSFVNSIESIGVPGNSPGQGSRTVIEKSYSAPVYALAQNLDKNQKSEGRNGPDAEGNESRVMDRDKENFQRFLLQISTQFGIKAKEPVTDQVVFDSFELFDLKDGSLSRHAIQLAAETIPLLKNQDTKLEIIIWASMPSATIIKRDLNKSMAVKQEVEKSFWIQTDEKSRLRYTVKPWLFSDAKRPVISFVVSRIIR